MNSIVVLHGLSGHAWDTFASTHHSCEGIKETCWLRDELPAFLEGQSRDIRPRVMTFGYHANVWVNNTVDGLDTPVSDLIHSLKVEREVGNPRLKTTAVLTLLGARTPTDH